MHGKILALKCHVSFTKYAFILQIVYRRQFFEEEQNSMQKKKFQQKKYWWKYMKLTSGTHKNLQKNVFWTKVQHLSGYRRGMTLAWLYERSDTCPALGEVWHISAYRRGLVLVWLYERSGTCLAIWEVWHLSGFMRGLTHFCL